MDWFVCYSDYGEFGTIKAKSVSEAVAKAKQFLPDGVEVECFPKKFIKY